MHLFYDNSSRYILLTLCCIFLIPSFICLRQGNQQSASILTMCCFNSLFFVANVVQKIPLPTVNGMVLFPLYSLLLGFPMKSMILISLTSIPHFISCLSQVKEIFQVTLNDEQARELLFLVLSMILNFIQVSSICLLKGYIEDNMWNSVESNYEKSETLTKEIVQVIEGRDAFIFSLSSEIENSLSSLNESLSYLLQRIKDSDHQEALKNIKLNNEVLKNTLNNILDVSKLKENRLELSQASTAFPDILEKAFSIYAGIMRRKDIHTEAYIHKKLPIKLWIDASWMLQIMINLISNALKYTLSHGKVNVYVTWCSEGCDKELLLKPIVTTFEEPLEAIEARRNSTTMTHSQRGNQDILDEFNGSETRSRLQNFLAIRTFETRNLQEVEDSIEMPSRPQNWSIGESEFDSANSNETLANKGYLKVQVTDNGQGIPASSLKALFEIFSQSKNHYRLTQAESTLGLWLCKQLCQKMNGDIQVFSTLHQGTTFVFYIPIDNTAITRNLPITHNTAAYIRPIGKVTALVVDDYAFNRDLHRLLLEKEDVHVIMASDGKEALETYIKYGGEYFDFIMMDVRMPVMNGFDSAKKMREWEVTENKRKVNICFVSGEYFDENEVINNLKVQGDQSRGSGIKCLRKPIDIGILRSLVRKYKVQA